MTPLYFGGLGLRANATLPAVEELLTRAAMRPPLTLPLRLQDHPLIPALAEVVHLSFVDEGLLRGVPTLTQSPRIKERFGTGSLSEALALLASSGPARLIGPRLISSDRSAALAIATLLPPSKDMR